MNEGKPIYDASPRLIRAITRKDDPARKRNEEKEEASEIETDSESESEQQTEEL